VRRLTIPPAARTVHPLFCLLLCVACGGKRFQSLPDAGDVVAATDVSHTTTRTSPTTVSATSSAQATTHEPSSCAKGTTCFDATQTVAPTTGPVTSVLTNADAGALEDAATGANDGDAATTCEQPLGCEATSTEHPSSSGSSANTSEPTSDETTIPPPDECPDHDDQLVRGSCGCGFEPSPSCETLVTHLAHRYTFDGTGKQLLDVVGAASGEIHNCELTGTSALEFDGNECYVELPSGLLSAFTDATLELWLRWDGGDADQRIFNFGTPASSGRTPESYISLSPRSGNRDVMTLSYLADPQDPSQTLRADDPVQTGDLQHVAVVIDSTQTRLSLYSGGQWVTSTDTSQDLRELQDRMVWLGRALYSDYPYFDGALLEFRIYDTALGEVELAQSALLGPDASLGAPQP
jgi:hypothetical protein